MKKKIVKNLCLSLGVVLAFSSCEKENFNSEELEEFVEEQKIEFYIDDKKVDENDSLLLGKFEARHVFCEENVDLSYRFTTKEKYVKFLKAKGYSENVIFDLTATDEELENKSRRKASTVDPSLMTLTAYRDLKRNKFLGVFTGDQELCGQDWENSILGMRIVAASSACQTGAMPAIITLYDKCDHSGEKIPVSLKKCRGGKKYKYAIAPGHFKAWKREGIRVSSWKYTAAEE